MMPDGEIATAAGSPGRRTVAEQLVFILAAVTVVLATLLTVRLALATRTGTVDSYYYFARAAELGKGVPLADTRINWGVEQVDRKFFPGYPVLLNAMSLGSDPDRAWRWVSVFFVIVDFTLLGFALRRLGLSFFASCAAVAMFASHPLPIRWMSMPMAEGAALLYLCLSAISLPKRGDPIKTAYPRFFISCILGGLAIQCRAEASYVSACIGLAGLATFIKKPGWLLAAAVGAVLGVLPFFWWVSSLPPATSGARSRLHYVNEFFEMFSWFDPEEGEGARGGVIDNFGRSWGHVMRNFGRNPFSRHEPHENEVLRAVWMTIFGAGIVVPVFGLVGSLAQKCAIAFIGFIVFRSFWYYPYDRFLITGLPIGFCALALVADWIRERRGLIAHLGCALVFIWVARSVDINLKYHIFERVQENQAHSYCDRTEGVRAMDQMDRTWFPVEGADMSVLAARRFSKFFESERTRRDADRRNEVIALEFPWPQICYALRPHPIVLGYPFVNFWGNAEYRVMETVPLDEENKPVRTPRTAVEFLRDRNVKYVITPLPRTIAESRDEKDHEYGTWIEQKQVSMLDYGNVTLLDTVVEHPDRKPKREWEWPRWVRILELKFPPRPVENK